MVCFYGSREGLLNVCGVSEVCAGFNTITSSVVWLYKRVFLVVIDWDCVYSLHTTCLKLVRIWAISLNDGVGFQVMGDPSPTQITIVKFDGKLVKFVAVVP